MFSLVLVESQMACVKRGVMNVPYVTSIVLGDLGVAIRFGPDSLLQVAPR